VREVRGEGEPDAAGRLPVHVRAQQLGRYVQSVDHVVLRAEAAEALGLTSLKGSLPRVAQAARANGYLAEGGRGFRRGPVTVPPEAP